MSAEHCTPARVALGSSTADLDRRMRPRAWPGSRVAGFRTEPAGTPIFASPPAIVDRPLRAAQIFTGVSA
jgi:hypothetical protein